MSKPGHFFSNLLVDLLFMILSYLLLMFSYQSFTANQGLPSQDSRSIWPDAHDWNQLERLVQRPHSRDKTRDFNILRSGKSNIENFASPGWVNNFVIYFHLLFVWDGWNVMRSAINHWKAFSLINPLDCNLFRKQGRGVSFGGGPFACSARLERSSQHFRM